MDNIESIIEITRKLLGRTDPFGKPDSNYRRALREVIMETDYSTASGILRAEMDASSAVQTSTDGNDSEPSLLGRNGHELTTQEKMLRDHLHVQYGGDELWMIVKAGFRRSYDLGRQDALEIAKEVLGDREEDLADVETTTDDRVSVIFGPDTSNDWNVTPEYNMMFLRQVTNHLNALLLVKRWVCLNDILSELGLAITLEGFEKIWSADDGDIIQISFPFNTEGSIELSIGKASKPRLTQTSAPVALVALLGHPANEKYVVKTQDGQWRDVETGEVVNDEDFRSGWVPYFADLETFAPIEP